MKGLMDPTGNITKKAAKQFAGVCFVSGNTQHRIHDGHRFTITSDDPNLLPSAELLKFRDRIMIMMTLRGGTDVDGSVLPSSSSEDDSPRVLFGDGDGDIEVYMENKILEWSERAEGELASLTTEEANEMVWTSSMIQQPEDMGDSCPPEVPED